jgi:hypothetical protein
MSQLGYIPTISAYNKLSHDSMVDLEWAYRFDRSFKGDSPEEHHEKLYRGWLRYSNQIIEARFGLQKVSSGRNTWAGPKDTFCNPKRASII